jgi:hypothetical protein
MPEIAEPPRPGTKRVKTITEQELPVGGTSGRLPGIGMPWQDYLREIPEDRLQLTEVVIYRRAPRNEGHIVKLGGTSDYPVERIDDGWIAKKLGGGTYSVKIYTKGFAQHYEPVVTIAGESKPSPWGGNPQPQQSSGNTDVSNVLRDFSNNLLEQLQKERAQDSTGAMDRILEMYEKASERAIDVVAKQRESSVQQPSSIAEIVTLATKLAEMQRPRDPISEKLLDAIVQRAFSAPAPARSFVEQLKELTTLKELLGMGGEGAKAAATNGWDIAERILDRTPDILEKISALNAQRTEFAKAQAAAAEARARVATVVPRQGFAPAIPPSQAPAPAERPPAAAAPLPMAALENPAEMTPQEKQETVAQIVEMHTKSRIAFMVAQGWDAATILDFVDGSGLIRNVGGVPVELGMLLRQATDKQIQEFLESDPILAGILKMPTCGKFLLELRQVIEMDLADEEAESSAKKTGPN